jgi:hypothetical protein
VAVVAAEAVISALLALAEQAAPIPEMAEATVALEVTVGVQAQIMDIALEQAALADILETAALAQAKIVGHLFLEVAAPAAVVVAAQAATQAAGVLVAAVVEA